MRGIYVLNVNLELMYVAEMVSLAILVTKHFATSAMTPEMSKQVG